MRVNEAGEQPREPSGCAAWLLIYLFTCLTLAGGSFYVAFYVAAAYAVVGPWAYYVFRRRRANMRARRTSWLVALAILLVPLLPYIAVEALTATLGRQLVTATQRSRDWAGNRAPVVSYKVLWAGPQEAHLYLVAPCDNPPDEENAGYLFRLRRSGRTWSVVDTPECIWSDCGNAEGNVFPPYFGIREF